jgi:uncharacterized repeat protein (TIGR01451 family)
MYSLLRRAARAALLVPLIVGLLLSSVPAAPVSADACARAEYVLQRLPLAGGAHDGVTSAQGKVGDLAEAPLHPQINVAEISVYMTDSPSPVPLGSNLTYTITVNNTGPDDATDIELADSLPAGTTFVSLTDPGGCWSCTTPAVGATGTVNCDHPHQAAGSSEVFTLVVLVTNSVPTGVPLQNTASITANVSDPAGGDHDWTTNTTVLAPTPTQTLTPTVTSTATITPTATSTVTSTPTPTSASTPTGTPVGSPSPGLTPTATTTGTPSPTATATPAVVVTQTPAPSATATVPPVKQSTDDTDKSRGRSETQHRSDDHTNQSGRDDYYAEGNVTSVVLDAQPPYAMIATRDGLMQVTLSCAGGCPTVLPGDYIQVDGVKENESLFFAEEVTVTRGR